MRARRLLLIAMLGLALAGLSGPAVAFPGICVGKDATPRFVHATQVAVMRHRDVSVVTVMVDYEGPLAPFALLLPVPSDVSAERVRTVRRGMLRRLEQLSAPRFYSFYEQEPCGPIPTEHSFDEHLRARGRGFLTPSELPVPDRHYAISNLISAPIEPVFKGSENEFRYVKLDVADGPALKAWLAARGYSLSEPALAALARYLGPSHSLLFAEVSLDHVEIVGPDRVQLGGIRYWTERPLGALPVTLGLENSRGTQDLLIYVLDRKQRYRAKNYGDMPVPGNLRVVLEASERVAGLYNALFDRLALRHPRAFITEFAWSTSGCGEPCPDVPLGLDELMSLGGDVIEARATTAQERALRAPAERARDCAQFEQRTGTLPPARRAAARRDRARDLRELGRRQALKDRQTYVLSRLHYSYDRRSLPNDVELGPAEPLQGGVGVPEGSAGEIAIEPRPAPENRLQARFVGFQFWNGEVSCSAPIRFRWGKRWSSEARAPRSLPLAMDLARAPRDPKLLESLLKTPLFAPAPAPSAERVRGPAAVPAKRRAGSCVIGSPSDNAGVSSFLLAVLAFTRRRRQR